MTTVTIVGAGLMTKPMVDYFLDKCKYNLIMLDMFPENAEKRIAGRPNAEVFQWMQDKPDVLEAAAKRSDIVVSMVPKPIHKYVADACMKLNKSMVTASYEIPDLMKLDGEAKEKGLLILNELGEVPGIDHFGTQLVLERIRKRGAKVTSLKSYGSSIPAFNSNDNPFHYKFAWDPITFAMASQTGASYFEKGKKIVVSGDELFNNLRTIKIEGLGTFESYPNKDIEKYMGPFGLDNNATFYRGLLRHKGYCENLLLLIKSGLFENSVKKDFTGKTYAQFIRSVFEISPDQDVRLGIASKLNISEDAKFIDNLEWVGLFGDDIIKTQQPATVAKIVIDKMTEKMSYKPGEHDLVMVHIEAEGELSDGTKIRETATLSKEGDPADGDSAISQAVALPVAISVKAILDGKIKATGAKMPPNIPELYPIALEGLKEFGLEFKCESSDI